MLRGLTRSLATAFGEQGLVIGCAAPASMCRHWWGRKDTGREHRYCEGPGHAEAAPELQRNSAAPTSLPEQGVLGRLFRWPKHLPPRLLLARRNLRSTELSSKAFSTIKPPLPAPTFRLQCDLHKYKTQTFCTLGSGAEQQNHRQDWNKRLRRGEKWRRKSWTLYFSSFQHHVADKKWHFFRQ